MVKKNGKPGPAGKCVYHMLDPLGRAFYAAGLARAKGRAFTDGDNGLVRGRRREGAILTAAIVEYRARQSGRSFVTSMKDMSNAFASCSWLRMGAANSKTLPQQMWTLGEQRYRRASFRVPCRDDAEGSMIHPRCGGLIGDPYMVQNVVATFTPGVRLDCRLPAASHLRALAVGTAPVVQGAHLRRSHQ
eukprot:1473611-Pyramimonas_sp.AAC.1